MPIESESLPPLRAEQDMHLRGELVPGLDESRRVELWWWVRQRGLRCYEQQPPDPDDLDIVSVYRLVDYILEREPEFQQADWVLCWYLYGEVSELHERERRLLALRRGRDLALSGLEPLPAWYEQTYLGSAMGRFGWP